jgi:hypothetical protein
MEKEVPHSKVNWIPVSQTASQQIGGPFKWAICIVWVKRGHKESRPLTRVPVKNSMNLEEIFARTVIGSTNSQIQKEDEQEEESCAGNQVPAGWSCG